MDPNIAGGLIEATGGLIALGLGVWIAVKQFEKQEFRRHQVDCLVNLYGSRFAMSQDLSIVQEDKSRFNFEINKIGVLFSDNQR